MCNSMSMAMWGALSAFSGNRLYGAMRVGRQWLTLVWSAVLFLALLASGLCVFCRVANAEPTTGGPLYAGFINQRRVVLDVTYIWSPRLKPRQARELQKQTVEKYRFNGVRIVTGRLRRVNDPFETFDGGRLYPEQYSDPFYAEFEYWKSRMKGRVAQYHVNYVMSPPWQFGGVGEWRDGDGRYLAFGGYATTGSVGGGCVATGSAAAFKMGGAPSINNSRLVLEHELGHCLGAEHDDESPNVMHSDAGHHLKGADELPILASSINEIDEVLK